MTPTNETPPCGRTAGLCGGIDDGCKKTARQGAQAPLSSNPKNSPRARANEPRGNSLRELHSPSGVLPTAARDVKKQRPNRRGDGGESPCGILWLNRSDGALAFDASTGRFELASGKRRASGVGREAFARACRRLDVELPAWRVPEVLR